MDDMGLIGLTIGPGSFTGLRIATTFAKTFAYATGAQVRAINTLRVLAFQAATSRQIAKYESIIAILDAQRQQLFAAEYKLNEEGEMVEQVPASIRSREFLNSCSDSELITGIGLRKVDLKNMNLNLAAEAAWHPTAKSTGRLAIADYQQGIVDDIWTLKPAYFRKSAAEEKAEQNSD
jgi:tRNA threonylcarbamoyladenosine biosynthesis protein TsaB